MEDNKKSTKDKSKAPGAVPQGAEWVDCLPTSKDSWRRVFNQDLRCYEVFVRGGNFLVATGIKSEADSYIIGILPALVDLVEEVLIQIKDGEVEERTYRGLKHILSEHGKAYRKTKRVDRVGLQRRDSTESDLGGEDS